MKNIAISGCSGFVGQELSNYFKNLGFTILPIPREVLSDVDELSSFLEGSDIVFNLAGANIIQKWNPEYKKELYDSRINSTKNLVKAFEKMSKKPKIFISTSAIGIYSNDKEQTEEDFSLSNNFLSKLCKDWENEAYNAKYEGIRTIIFRFPIVLGKNGGAFKKMILPFKLGLGGILGDGKQHFSYIHILDLCRAYEYIINCKNCSGIYNLCTSHPTNNLTFTKTLGKHLNRPTIFPVPSFILKLLFGEGSSVLLDGQRVYGKRLFEAGFNFKYPNIESVLEDLTK